MRRRFAYFTISLVSLVLAGACKQSPADTHHAEAAVDTVLVKFAAAMSERDFSALDKVWADEFTFVSHDGEMFTKAQLLELLRSGTEKFESLVLEDVNIRTYGDTAVVTANSTQKATLEGKDHSGTARVSIVLVKMRHGWRIVLAQLSELKPSAKPARAAVSMGSNTKAGTSD